jgi:hypothetical protein
MKYPQIDYMTPDRPASFRLGSSGVLAGHEQQIDVGLAVAQALRDGADRENDVTKARDDSLVDARHKRQTVDAFPC